MEIKDFNANFIGDIIIFEFLFCFDNQKKYVSQLLPDEETNHK